MKMGTCEQPQPAEQPREPGNTDGQREGLNMQENNLTITGPPASRTVIDNLKKLLLQRQHSRESDTENNRNIALRSDQGSNSDAAFYSQFSTSSSDSDDSSDYMIFQEISNQEGCNSSEGRRKHRRRRSYSSSSSSSSSPVARCRRKVTRVNVTLASSIGGAEEGSIPQKPALEEQVHNNEFNDSANSTSSHKDSSSEDDFPGANNSKSLSSSEEVAPSRCAKLKSRRDRDRKRKRYELSYTSHRPKLLKATDSATNTLAGNEESSHNTHVENTTSNGENKLNKGSNENEDNTNTGIPSTDSAEKVVQEKVAENPSEENIDDSSSINNLAQNISVSSSSTTTTVNPTSPATTCEKKL